MAKSVTYKILEKHLTEGELKKGNEIGIHIDTTLTQDATGTMADLQYEQMGIDRVQTMLSVSYIDHNTLQMGFENADDHRYLTSFARKYGLVLSKAGNGICHQVNIERFGVPGRTLLGSDSHTPTGGGIGMISIGAGGLDIASAMAGLPFYIRAPRIYGIHLTGRLKPFVSAKDLILKILSILGVKGNVGWVAEYYGSGVATLSVPERATITNMGAELGVTTSVFPSDNTTKEFLKLEGRQNDWNEITAEDDSEYDKIIEIDLSELEPMVALPHSPGNVKRIKEIEGMTVDQVLVGSCTNSSYRDLTVAADLTAQALQNGKKVNRNVSFGVAPGSRQVAIMTMTNSSFLTFEKFGARMLESACGFCIGNGMAPKTDAISIRTNNRNFYGRSGTLSAKVYLTSPETAIACAITGKITDPRDLENMGIKYPEFRFPKQFVKDDTLFEFPLSIEESKKIELYRGPNIVQPPAGEALPKSIDGEVSIKVDDNITTDHIMPAGARLKYRSNVPAYSQFVFETVDSTFPKRALKNKKDGLHNIIVAGESYGQGSSREHAALCPMYLGVRAVIAKSMERIHKANLINFGILPLTFKNPDDYDKITVGDKIVLENVRSELIGNSGTIKLNNKTKNISIDLLYDLSERERKTVLLGGTMQVAKSYRGKSFKEIIITE
ncbi:MAG: aconitate hydratase [Epsilonproteobacteria bacterium]|nr:aconitate hydratase [Campylobacterota bacterium]